MTFIDAQLPRRIAFGAGRRVGWSTTIAATRAGIESRNQNWSRSRYAYDISWAVRTASEFELVVAHFHTMRGRAHTFPFKDHQDYQAGTGGILVDSGDSPQVFLMFKRYGTTNSFDRRITRPKSGTLAFFKTIASVTTDITADATVDYTTGEVEISSSVVGATLTWTGEFFVPCRYDTDELPSVVENRRPGEDGELLVISERIMIVEDRDGA